MASIAITRVFDHRPYRDCGDLNCPACWNIVAPIQEVPTREAAAAASVMFPRPDLTTGKSPAPDFFALSHIASLPKKCHRCRNYNNLRSVSQKTPEGEEVEVLLCDYHFDEHSKQESQ
jgi:hypothetical protein